MRREGRVPPHLYVPFLNVDLSLSWPVYMVFSAFVIVGAVNAVNITDGLDGLAASVSVPVALFYVTAAAWWGVTQVGVFAGAVLGGLLAFLLFNAHPAKVFMGDTGSLFLGGAVAGMAFAIDLPLILVPVGIVYIIETLSDILQVAYFKLTHGKRIFKMAPIHHHFEMCGWSEVKIVTVFEVQGVVAQVGAGLGVGEAGGEEHDEPDAQQHHGQQQEGHIQGPAAISANGAARWLGIPNTSLTFQPSDLAKLGLIVFFAESISKKREKMKDLKEGFLYHIGILLVMVAMTALEPHFSGAILIAGIGAAMLVVGGIHWGWIAAGVSAVGEGEGYAGGGDEVGDHRDVQKGLQRDLGGDAHDQQAPEPVPGVDGQPEAPDDQQGEQRPLRTWSRTSSRPSTTTPPGSPCGRTPSAATWPSGGTRPGRPSRGCTPSAPAGCWGWAWARAARSSASSPRPRTTTSSPWSWRSWGWWAAPSSYQQDADVVEEALLEILHLLPLLGDGLREKVPQRPGQRQPGQRPPVLHQAAGGLRGHQNQQPVYRYSFRYHWFHMLQQI